MEVREKRLEQMTQELDRATSRPSRGKGHWLKSYARNQENVTRCKKSNNPRRDLRLRREAFWKNPSWARQTMWGYK